MDLKVTMYNMFLQTGTKVYHHEIYVKRESVGFLLQKKENPSKVTFKSDQINRMILDCYVLNIIIYSVL
jgi:hypothetical protein